MTSTPLKSIRLVVNQSPRELQVDPDRSLLDVLRHECGLKAAHFGCGEGECGACMVLLDGRAIPACDTPMWSVEGKTVITPEGLGTSACPHPVQRAFVAEQAAQCGYCTSGMMIAAASLLAQHPHPTREDILAGMERNLCRCGTHLRVIRAIERAAGEETPA